MIGKFELLIALKVGLKRPIDPEVLLSFNRFLRAPSLMPTLSVALLLLEFCSMNLLAATLHITADVMVENNLHII